MNTETAAQWGPISEIASPVETLSFCFTPPDRVDVRLHFFNAMEKAESCFSLTFSGVVAVQLENESFEFIPLPRQLPKCSSDQWRNWIYPILRINNSSWLSMHRAMNSICTKDREHFVVVSMNDRLHILAKQEIEGKWSSPEA